VGTKAFEHNPFDEHTLRKHLEQTGILMQDTITKPNTGYRREYNPDAYFGECDRSFRRIVTGGLTGDFSAVSVT
jgi:hypothetical protein